MGRQRYSRFLGWHGRVPDPKPTSERILDCISWQGRGRKEGGRKAQPHLISHKPGNAGQTPLSQYILHIRCFTGVPQGSFMKWEARKRGVQLICKTLGQLSLRSSSSTGLMQEVEIQLLLFFFLPSSFFSLIPPPLPPAPTHLLLLLLKRNIWLWIWRHTKGPQKGDRNLLPSWPAIALLEAGLRPRDKQPFQRALRRPLWGEQRRCFSRPLRAWRLQERAPRGCFCPRKLGQWVYFHAPHQPGVQLRNQLGMSGEQWNVHIQLWPWLKAPVKLKA